MYIGLRCTEFQNLTLLAVDSELIMTEQNSSLSIIAL